MTIQILDFDRTSQSLDRAATHVRLARREERRWDATDAERWQRWDHAAFYAATADRPRLVRLCLARRDRLACPYEPGGEWESI
jgi:hypothetical protein